MNIRLLSWLSPKLSNKLYNNIFKEQPKQLFEISSQNDLVLEILTRRKTRRYEIYFFRFLYNLVLVDIFPRILRYRKRRFVFGQRGKSNKRINTLIYNFSFNSMQSNLILYLFLCDKAFQNQFGSRNIVRFSDKSLIINFRNYDAFSLKGFFDITNKGDWHYSGFLTFNYYDMINFYNDIKYRIIPLKTNFGKKSLKNLLNE